MNKTKNLKIQAQKGTIIVRRDAINIDTPNTILPPYFDER
jgi:hypothetical protein